MTKLQGISPKIPLVYDGTDGPYQLNKNIGEAIKQNLKMLLLTSPGERIMVPNFGVGLYGFLFENITSSTFSSLASKITEQVNFYIPAVNIEEIDFNTSDTDPTLQFNEVRVSIKYNISPFNQRDELIITSTTTN
jgi:phage baseplate assembly protein W|tara:strand:- start:757 stop:1161 length:405 start_codon:yes stop_codon:yes gene_type:complete